MPHYAQTMLPLVSFALIAAVKATAISRKPLPLISCAGS